MSHFCALICTFLALAPRKWTPQQPLDSKSLLMVPWVGSIQVTPPEEPKIRDAGRGVGDHGRAQDNNPAVSKIKSQTELSLARTRWD